MPLNTTDEFLSTHYFATHSTSMNRTSAFTSLGTAPALVTTPISPVSATSMHRWLQALALTSCAVLVAGCGGATGAPGKATLTSMRTEAAGSNCPTGGTRILSGLDTNTNGTLDDDEVVATQFVCNGAAGATGATGAAGDAGSPGPAGDTGATGAPGMQALVRVSFSEAPCPGGIGSRIDAGLDTNGNGIFDDPVTSTAYVCNGSNGRNSLIQQASEPAGSNCANGGTRIVSGIDTNGNGTLQPGEINATSYVCNPPATGLFTWQDVTDTSVQATSNTGYMADSTSQVVVTLPANPAVGDRVAVSGTGTGGWMIAQNAGQTIVTKGLPGGSATAGAIWTSHESNRYWRSVASSSDGNKLVAIATFGQIYTSTDAGATWTAHDSNRSWTSVASSSDGSKLVAGEAGGSIYTSTDSGITWTASTSAGTHNWQGVASSSDGSKLAAIADSAQIYTSSDFGATWTPHESNRSWTSVASSSDGNTLAATAFNGQIYISTDAGTTWVPHESNRQWRKVASSSDGAKLAAVVANGQIYTSTDTGVTWVAHESNRQWRSVASSSDGSKLVAVENGGLVYTSSDSGATWMPHEVSRSWFSVASSSDGSKLVAGVDGGQIFTSAAIDRTTAGTAGTLSGAQYDTVELQYLGGGVFMPTHYVSYSGSFTVQ